MITTTKKNKKVTVAFHIGRGGCFNNQEYKSFLPGITSLQQCFRESSTVISKDKNDIILPDNLWKLIDGEGKTILEGRENIESTTGILKWNTYFDTDIIRNIEDCTDEEMTILFKAYTIGQIDDVDTINYICEHEGYKHILDVDFEGNKAVVKFSDNSSLILDLDTSRQNKMVYKKIKYDMTKYDYLTPCPYRNIKNDPSGIMVGDFDCYNCPFNKSEDRRAQTVDCYHPHR